MNLIDFKNIIDSIYSLHHPEDVEVKILFGLINPKEIDIKQIFFSKDLFKSDIDINKSPQLIIRCEGKPQNDDDY